MKTVIGFYCGGAGCHNEGQPPNYFPDNDATLYRTLTEYKVAKCGGRVLVKPCAPAESAFYLARQRRCAVSFRGCPSVAVKVAARRPTISRTFASGSPRALLWTEASRWLQGRDARGDPRLLRPALLHVFCGTARLSPAMACGLQLGLGDAQRDEAILDCLRALAGQFPGGGVRAAAWSPRPSFTCGYA